MVTEDDVLLLLTLISGIFVAPRLLKWRGPGARAHDRPTRDVDPAPLGADAMPVIGGASCALCALTIQSRLDGTACADCARPLHYECRAAHAAKCGRVATSYRT